MATEGSDGSDAESDDLNGMTSEEEVSSSGSEEDLAGKCFL